MIRVLIPVIVEGRYDKAKLKSIIDAVVITTDGFAVFNNIERRALIRRLGERGVIILSDSDGGGRVIRSHLRGMLGGITVYDLYIPQIAGKESRKSAPSKEGFLGVEGVSAEILRGIFEKFARAYPELCILDGDFGGLDNSENRGICSAELYELGLSGGVNSSKLRDFVSEQLGLPRGMSSKAFREAAEIISSISELEKIVSLYNRNFNS